MAQQTHASNDAQAGEDRARLAILIIIKLSMTSPTVKEAHRWLTWQLPVIVLIM